MARSRASAKQAGSSFERLIADHLRDTVDDRIDRKVRTGARDTGDIANVRLGPHRIVVEAKNCAKQSLPEWVKEAQAEAVNDNALVGVVVSKRHGKGAATDQWVHMTVADLVKILNACK